MLLTGCYVGMTANADMPIYDACESSPVPRIECEYDYYWINQAFIMNGVWHGGRYEHILGHPRVRYIRPRHY